MVRWVAFDDDTAEAVVSRLRRGAAEINSTTPVEAALLEKGPSVVLLPASTPGRVLIARFSKRQESQSPAANSDPAAAAISTISKKPSASVSPKPWWRRFVA
jgi:hypothetical protein